MKILFPIVIFILIFTNYANSQVSSGYYKSSYAIEVIYSESKGDYEEFETVNKESKFEIQQNYIAFSKFNAIWLKNDWVYQRYANEIHSFMYNDNINQKINVSIKNNELWYYWNFAPQINKYKNITIYKGFRAVRLLNESQSNNEYPYTNLKKIVSNGCNKVPATIENLIYLVNLPVNQFVEEMSRNGYSKSTDYSKPGQITDGKDNLNCYSSVLERKDENFDQNLVYVTDEYSLYSELQEYSKQARTNYDGMKNGFMQYSFIANDGNKYLLYVKFGNTTAIDITKKY